MRYQPLPPIRARVILTCAENQIMPYRIDQCIHCCGRLCGAQIGMNSDSAKILMESTLKKPSISRIQRLSR